MPSLYSVIGIRLSLPFPADEIVAENGRIVQNVRKMPS